MGGRAPAAGLGDPRRAPPAAEACGTARSFKMLLCRRFTWSRKRGVWSRFHRGKRSLENVASCLAW